MDEAQHNREIEEIANMMVHDNTSPDEQDEVKLQKYKLQAMKDCSIGDAEAMQLVYEALLYRKLRSSDGSHDPLQKGNKFGAGFS